MNLSVGIHGFSMICVFLLFIVLSPTTPQQAPSCSKKSDIVFVVDQSGSIKDNNPKNGSWDNWVLIKQFIVAIVRNSNISYSGTHIGLLTFGNIAVPRFHLNEFYSVEAIVTAIENIPSGQGQTNTYAGLYTTRVEMFSTDYGARTDVQHIAIVITDGFANLNTDKTFPEAEACYEAGIAVFVIGMTSLIDEAQLSNISSPPHIKGQNYWTTPDYTSLATILSSVQNATCNLPKNVQPGCQIMDLIFAVHIPTQVINWNNIKNFIKLFITLYLPVGSDQVRIGFVTYDASEAIVRFNLSSFSTEDEIKLSIDQISNPTTDYADPFWALRLMRTTVFPGARPGVAKVAILLMDNTLNNINNVRSEAMLLQQNSTVRLIAVDLISVVGLSTLRSLTSQPEDIIISVDYKFLSAKIQLMEAVLCSPGSTSDVLCPKVADIIIILDESTSIIANGRNENWYTYELGFALTLIQAFPISLNLTRFGVLKFSNSASPSIYLSQSTSYDWLQTAIKGLQIQGGDTNIADALRQTRQVMFSQQNGARVGVPRLALLVTDGMANIEATQTEIEANLTKEAGIEVFTIGMTNQVDVRQLQVICSSPVETHYFYVDDISKLNTIIQDVISKSCNALPTVKTTSTTVTTPITTTPGTTSEPTTMTTLTTQAITTVPVATTTTFPTTTTAPITSEAVTNATTTKTTILPTTTTAEPNLATTTTTTTAVVTTTTEATTASTTTRQTSKPLKSCQNMIDLVFVLDSTTNVNYNFYITYLLGFAQNITSSLDIDGGRARVGVISFCETATVQFLLNTFTSSDFVSRSIGRIPYSGYSADLGQALNLLWSVVFTPSGGARQGSQASKFAIVITDNVSFNQSATLIEAEQVKRVGIKVVVIGIGTYLDRFELSKVASFPYTKTMFVVETARNISQLLQPVMSLICNDVSSCANAVCQGGGGRCSEVIGGVRCGCPAGQAGDSCNLVCSGGADIVFALDSSRSITLTNFQQMTSFVTTVVDSLDTDSGPDGPTISRVAVLTFSSTAIVRFYLNTYQDKIQLLDAINVPYDGAPSTNLAQAIRYTREILFTTANGDRQSRRNYLVVMTDGVSDNTTASWQEAMMARQAGISIMAIGIGPDCSSSELMSVASFPDSVNVFIVPRFASLNDSLRSRVASALCNNENYCASNPCLNGADCRGISGGYECGPCPLQHTGFNCERDCSGQIDLVFLLLSSGSVHQDRWLNMTNFASSIIRQLDVNLERTRIGLVYWSDQSYIGFPLDRYNNRQDVIQAVTFTPYLNGRTNTASALRILRQDVFQGKGGDRPDARNIAIVVTNQVSTVDIASTVPEAIQCHLAGIQMVVVGVEQQVYNSTELEAIASLPLSNNLIYVSSFRLLPSIVDKVISQTCNSINECSSNPCINNGTCIDDYGRYSCLCGFSYTGYNCERQCVRQMDIVFLLDVSGSVQDEYHLSIAFARQVAYGLDINYDQVRVGAVAFSTGIDGQFYLNDNLRSRQGVIDSLNFSPVGGSTNTPLGLDDVRNYQFTSGRGDRSGIQNILVLLSDGYSTVDPELTPVKASLLRNDGVVIYCVALGESPQWSELNSIASSPLIDHVLGLNSTRSIDAVAKDLLDRLCL